MAAVEEFQAGGYRFIPGGFQFSGGVAASAGYEIKRCRFRAPVPLMEGFARIETVIRAAGRPLAAFCACELRSPGQFTEQGFHAFSFTVPADADTKPSFVISGSAEARAIDARYYELIIRYGETSPDA